MIKSSNTSYNITDSIFINLLENKGLNIKNKYIANINSNDIECTILELTDNNATVKLSKPVYIELNDKITISFEYNNNIDLIAFGAVISSIII